MAPARTENLSRALWLGWLLSTWLYACAEALQVPLRVYTHRPWLLFGAVAHAATFQLMYVPVALWLQLTALARVQLAPSLGLRGSMLWHALPAALVSAEMLWVLSDNPGFLSHLPPVVLIASLAPLLTWAYAWLGWTPRTPRRWHALVHGAVIGAAATLGAALLYAINYTAFPGKYPSYHLALTQLSLVLLQLGLTHLVACLRSEPRRMVAVRAACGATALGLVGPALLGAAPEARALFMHHSLLGDGQCVVHAYEPWREDARARPLPAVADPAGEFRTRVAFPVLPAGFALDGLNVLLIVSEATRHDQTSLAGAALDTTPALAAFAARSGVQTFTDAYSPSTGTLFSMASVHAMTYPSATRVQAWQRRWNGELSAATDTVAELFAREGRHTFWIGHNMRCIFDTRVLGFAQGFESVQHVPCEAAPSDPDTWIADASVAKLEALARATEQRFFGWVFLSAPHGPYTPSKATEGLSKLERYRLEVRHMDSQLKRILDALDSTGLMERTVVLFMGDHGEEFGEHGGESHATEVFGESAHVPLVVHVPSMQRGLHARPVSTTHALPWLLLHGGRATRPAVEARLRREIVPMLRATDNAVLIELLGQDRMRSALRTQDRSVLYDFIAGLPSVYDLRRDPGELDDLYELGPDAVRADLAQIEAYRTLRASTRRFGLLPDKFVQVPGE